MLPCDLTSRLRQFRRLLCVAAMSSVPQLLIRDGYREAGLHPISHLQLPVTKSLVVKVVSCWREGELGVGPLFFSASPLLLLLS